jgi:hypothetical protein
VLIFVALLGVAFLAVGLLALWNTRTIDHKGKQRTAQINNLETQQHDAICALVLGSIQRDSARHEPVSPLVIQFGKDYKCVPPVVPPPGVGG